ncbi:MAG: 30S ribosome-binding factor RbfA [Saprospiraceae bacterium]|jgi:ribosome-binding factor A
METIKQRQIGELVKRHFSLTLQEEGSYIYGTAPLVTVTSVKMSPDLSLAKIYLSVYNTEHKQAVILEMEEEKARLRQLLAGRLRRQVRRVPEIDFYLDDTLDEMARLQQLFNRLHEENAMGKDSEE